MKQMSVQRRLAVQSLDETNSPFVMSKKQQIFQNSANQQLSGSTFDATHMDNFLEGQFGDKGNSSKQFTIIDSLPAGQKQSGRYKASDHY